MMVQSCIKKTPHFNIVFVCFSQLCQTSFMTALRKSSASLPGHKKGVTSQDTQFFVRVPLRTRMSH